MKKWKLFVLLTGFTLALSACQGGTSGKSSDAAPAAGQETTVQGEAAEKETEDAAGEDNEDKAQESEAGEATSAANAEEIAVSNPMQEVSGPEALAEIGVSMEVPESVELGQCFIISQVVAEVNFTLNDASYTYRGSATAEDFAGIFEEFEEEVVSIAAADEMAVDGELTIKTTKSGGKLAAWSKNGANYTLYTPASAGEEELVSLCRELTAKN